MIQFSPCGPSSTLSLHSTSLFVSDLLFYNPPGNCRANIFRWGRRRAESVLKRTCQMVAASIWLLPEPGTACQIQFLNYVSL